MTRMCAVNWLKLKSEPKLIVLALTRAFDLEIRIIPSPI